MVVVLVVVVFLGLFIIPLKSKYIADGASKQARNDARTHARTNERTHARTHARTHHTHMHV